MTVCIFDEQVWNTFSIGEVPVKQLKMPCNWCVQIQVIRMYVDAHWR